MDRLPAELWIYIFSLACTDGGHTGRALSIVSRRFNKLSKPYTLQCLAVTTPRQVRLLADTLERPEFQGGGVKSLFICCPDLSLDDGDDDDSDYMDDGSEARTGSTASSNSEGKTSEEDGMDIVRDADDGERHPSLSSEGRAELAQGATDIITHGSEDSPPSDPNEAPSHLAQLTLLDQDIRKKDEEAVNNLFRLLNLVSATLAILSVHWTSLEGYLTEEMFPPLPHLQELCIYRSFTGEDEVEPQAEEPAPLLFPSLKRLHFGGYVDERPGSYSQYLSNLAPSLNQLRCSIYDFTEPIDGEEHRLPSTVSRIILEANTVSQHSADIVQSKEAMESLLFGSEGTSSSGTLEFSLLNNTYHADEWERRWLSRTDGGCGCW